MSPRILVVSIMRMGSTRVPDKMMQKIGGVSLAEIAIRNLREVDSIICNTSVDVGVLVRDEELFNLARQNGVQVFNRSEGSVAVPQTDRIWSLCGDDVHKKYDVVLKVNPCMPFLTVDTIKEAIEHSKEHPFWTSVYKNYGWLWGAYGEMLSRQGSFPRSDINGPPYYTMGSIFWSFSSESLNWLDLTRWQKCAEGIRQYDKTTGIEFFDVDTPEDLELARIIAQNKELQKDQNSVE